MIKIIFLVNGILIKTKYKLLCVCMVVRISISLSK